MTDNGPAYRSPLFNAALDTAGIKEVYTRPYTPRTNGKAERFIQTMIREWAYAAPYANELSRHWALPKWITTTTTRNAPIEVSGIYRQCHEYRNCVNNVFSIHIKKHYPLIRIALKRENTNGITVAETAMRRM